MDVFLKEPLLDWQKFARRQAKASKDKKHEDIGNYAREKLSLAKLKLERTNPAGWNSFSFPLFWQAQHLCPHFVQKLLSGSWSLVTEKETISPQ